ncbi:hypothetical protein KAH55_05030 [bacterium]|nr:hypothetical protein [bacterium]
MSGIEFPKQAWVEVHCAASDSGGNRSKFSMNFQIETYDRDILLIEIIKLEPGKYVSLAILNELVFDVWDTSSYVQSEKILVDFYTDTTGRNGANT